MFTTQPAPLISNIPESTPENGLTVGFSMRLIAIWNHGFRKFHVIAEDHAEALTIAAGARIIRRANSFRKYVDETDIADPELTELLAGDRKGVVEFKDGKWGFR